MNLKKSLIFVASATTLLAPLSVMSCNKTEVTKLKKELEQANSKISEYEAKVNELTTKKTEYEAKLAELNTKIDEYKAQLADETDKNKIKELTSKIEKLQEVGNAYQIGLSNIWNSFAPEATAGTLTEYRYAQHAYDIMKNQDMLSTSNVVVNNDSIQITKPAQGKSIPVVFMDIDETVLNNFNYQNWLMINLTSFNQADWTKYVSKAQGKEKAGAIAFIKYVWDHGGVVMFNSNRNQDNQKEGTIENLVNLGLDRKYMPDWVWWMQKVDLNAEKPWLSITNSHSHKEERMNYVNTHLLNIEPGLDVSFKVVMKVGDDINDFNDNFTRSSKAKKNAELVNQTLLTEKVGKLYGNLDLNNKEQYYDEQNNTWIDKDWSSSYVLIAGNSSYGSFVPRILHSYDYTTENVKAAAATWVANMED